MKKQTNSSSPYTNTTDFAAVCASHNMRKATRVITSIFEERLRPLGLRITQLTLLMALQKTESITITKLSDVLAMDRTTLSRELKPLAEQGLISISEGDDRRRRLIALTPTGRTKLETAVPLWRDAQTRVVEHIGADRYEALLGYFRQIDELRT